MNEGSDVERSPKQEWIEVFPFGVTISADEARPIMLFRDASEKISLPIWLSPIDAGISLSQEFQNSAAISPHHLTYKILKELGVILEVCSFVEINGHSQIVELKFNGDQRLEKLKHRADECLSFCLFAKAKFFASQWFIQRSRELKSEIQTIQQGLKLEPEIARNQHPYMM